MQGAPFSFYQTNVDLIYIYMSLLTGDAIVLDRTTEFCQQVGEKDGWLTHFSYER